MKPDSSLASEDPKAQKAKLQKREMARLQVPSLGFLLSPLMHASLRMTTPQLMRHPGLQKSGGQLDA